MLVSSTAFGGSPNRDPPKSVETGAWPAAPSRSEFVCHAARAARMPRTPAERAAHAPPERHLCVVRPPAPCRLHGAQERREGVRRQAASTLPPPRCSGAPRGRDTGQILARLDIGWILARASSGRQHLAASTVPQERREGEILGRFCVDTGWILARASSGRQHLAASTVPQDRRQGVRRQAACTLRTLPF